MAGRCLLVHLLLPAVMCGTAFCGNEALGYLKDKEFHQWVSKYHKEGENLAEIYPTWRRNADFDVGSLVREKHLVPHVSNVMPIDLNPADIPTSVDWRDKGVVPPIIDQGKCGDASVFAGVDSMDALRAIKNGELVLGSYEESIDCCFNGSCYGTDAHNFSLYSCVVNLGGLAYADQYNSIDHKCESDMYPAVVKIKGAAYVTAYSDEKVLAIAVARQPVAVAVDASHQSFMLYEGGVYYNSNCSSKPTDLDHSMLVVGYGTMNGEDYWIAKNSWGNDIRR